MPSKALSNPSVQALYEAIQAECAKPTWTRAMQMSRSATVTARRTHNGEIELRITTKGGMTSPLVVLSPKDLEWTCNCTASESVCIHAASAVIALREAEKQDEVLPGFQRDLAKLAYRLTQQDGALALSRWVVRGDKQVPLETRLAAAQHSDSGQAVAASQADLTVDVALGSLVAGIIPRPAMERVLTALAECDDVTLQGRPIKVADPLPVLRVVLDDHPDGFLLKVIQDPTITEVFSNGAVVRGSTLHAFGENQLSSSDVAQLREGKLFEYGQVADLVGRVLPALRERVNVDVRSKVLPGATRMLPRIAVRADFDGETLHVLPTLVYGNPPCARVDGGKLTYLGGKLPLRDLRREAPLIERLRESLELEIGKTKRFFGHGAVAMAERLRTMDDVTLEGEGLEACFVAAPLETSLSTSTGAVDLQFTSLGVGDAIRHASPEAVVRAWQRGEALVPLLEGGYAPLPADFLARYGHLIADLVAARDARGEIAPSAGPDVVRLCEALEQPVPPKFEALRQIAVDFTGIPETTLPEDLTATLRDYQRRGIDWLAFLSSMEMGAMLADDMGLGKTLQALCVVRGPCLVVCPASVLHNWKHEIERFRPSMRVHTYHGPQRRFDPKADITLTTYAIVRIDADVLAAHAWDTVVLDEAQMIKNADSQVARAAFQLRARFRLTLSGTPVENRLDELWSQMHFLNPGLLGGRQDFQERYAKPIMDGDSTAATRLQTRIRPFLLRRLKREVAKELPPRTDIVLRCSLDEHERALYEAIRAATQKEVLQELEAGGSVMAALEALLRLRQACCHAGLLPGQEADNSSKLRLLLETLESVLAEGHKALVFSQWTSLLDRVEPHFKQANISYLRLDGSTRDRAGVVEAFQADDGPPVLLISLRAGGTGLNLTAADHVFLLDPWWNPAVEDQAADRAHRIGQDKPVLVHRLVAEDTVEERLLSLQDRKRTLAAVATAGADRAAGLTRDDLSSLLR